jgi:hypothetical protein
LGFRPELRSRLQPLLTALLAVGVRARRWIGQLRFFQLLLRFFDRLGGRLTFPSPAFVFSLRRNFSATALTSASIFDLSITAAAAFSAASELPSPFTRVFNSSALSRRRHWLRCFFQCFCLSANAFSAAANASVPFHTFSLDVVFVCRILERRLSVSYFVRRKDEGAFLFRHPFSRVTIAFNSATPLLSLRPKVWPIIQSRRSEEFAVGANCH